MFFKILVLKNLGKFTAKHLYRSLFFNKVAGFQVKVLFFCEFRDIFKKTYFREHLWTAASDISSKSVILTVFWFQLSAKYNLGSIWDNFKATLQLEKKERQDKNKYKIFIPFYCNFKKKFKKRLY